MSTYELTKRDKTYRDVSLAFKPNPLNGDITVLQNERAINNSVKNIVMTLPSEVPFLRDFGSTVTHSLFYNVNDEAAQGILIDEIKRAVLFNEPRVTFDNPVEGEVAGASYLESSDRSAYNSVIDNPFLDDQLGVSISGDPDNNSLEVTIKYRIVGSVRIIRVQQILTPTR
jgi:phage baseplate assembly protein W